MKKKFVVLCMLSLSCLLLFAACGNTKDETVNQNPPVETTPTEVPTPAPTVTEVPEQVERPAPEASITITAISSTENLELADTWNIHEDGATYLVFSSAELTSLALYETDLANGMAYDASAPLGFCENVAANAFLSMNITVPESDIPSLLLVAEEASGALGKYLLCYDAINSNAYLIPVM